MCTRGGWMSRCVAVCVFCWRRAESYNYSPSIFTLTHSCTVTSRPSRSQRKEVLKIFFYYYYYYFLDASALLCTFRRYLSPPLNLF